MDFIRGVKAYFPAFEMLFSRKFRKFLWFPVFVVFILFLAGNWLVAYAGDNIYGLFEDRLRAWVGGISWLQWLTSATGMLIRILLRIVYFFLFMAFGGYIVLIVMSPVYSWLSERTEAALTGHEYPFSWRQLLWEVFRGIGIALRNMIFQLFFTVVFMLCSFIPLIGLLSPLAVFLTSAYFYGFSFMDYTIERKRFNVKESVRYVNRNIGTVTGIGSVFALALMIPWFSLIVCSFVSLLSVMAAAIAISEQEKNK